MANLRLILVALHIFITLLLIYHLHPHPSSLPKTCVAADGDSATVAYVSHSFSIALYHSSCIFVVWYSRRYGARIIRASGVLLIGELLQMLAVAVQHGMRTHTVSKEELFLDIVHGWTFFATIVITFRLAKQISKQENDQMQLELLAAAVARDDFMDCGGDLALV